MLISRLMSVYGMPEHIEDPKAFLDELARLVRSYPNAIQDAAADALMRTHKPTRLKPWPSPADICEACADAAAAVAPQRDNRPPEWTREAVSQAYRVLRTDIGRRAADEGWALALWRFVRINRRVPTAAEAAGCRDSAKALDDAYSHLLRNPALPLAGPLVRLGESMLARRDALSRYAHGEIIDTSATRNPAGEG